MPIRNKSIKKSLSKDKLATNIKVGKKKSQKQFSKRVNKRNRSKRNKRKRGGSEFFDAVGEECSTSAASQTLEMAEGTPQSTIVNWVIDEKNIPYGLDEEVLKKKRDANNRYEDEKFGVPDNAGEGTIIARLEADTKDATGFQLYGNCAATEADQGGGKSDNFDVVNGNELILAKKFRTFSCQNTLMPNGASIRKKGIFIQVKAVNEHGTQANATPVFIYLR